MKYGITLSFIIFFTMGAFSQTKKIANASHASSGPTFNWSSSDNLGAIMDYERFEKIKIVRPKAALHDSLSLDSISKPDTAVYEKVSENHTLIIEEAHTVEQNHKNELEVKDSEPISSTKTRKNKKKKRRKKSKTAHMDVQNVKKEVRQPEVSSQNPDYAGLQWLSLLVLIPIGLLVVKKP